MMRIRSLTKKAVLFSLLLLPCISQSQIILDTSVIKITTVAENLHWPWEIIWGPDNSIWMTQPGKVSRVNPTTGKVTILLSIPDYALTEGSRQMGLAVGPTFATDHFVYIDYNYAGAYYNEPRHHHLYMKIVRYTYNSATDRLENPFNIIDGIRIFDGYHDGGKLIVADNHLFLSIGDAKQVENPQLHPYLHAGDPYLSQNLNVFNGKILRINLDGSVPQDNPFAIAPYERIPRNFIWTYGHRNTQGLVLGNNNRIYYAEHGRENDDEFGIIEKGKNYGWPLIEGFCDTPAEQMSCDTIINRKEPLVSWNPNVAPSNMEFVKDSPIEEFKNSILVGTLTGDNFGNHIAAFTLNPGGTTVLSERSLLNNQYGRIRDFCISPQGDIFFTTSQTTAGSSPPGYDKILKMSFEGKKQTIVGMEDTSKIEMKVYPNPTGNRHKIFLSLTEANGVIELLELNGRIMETFTVQSKEMAIEPSSHLAGMYLIRYRRGNKSLIRKLLVN